MSIRQAEAQIFNAEERNYSREYLEKINREWSQKAEVMHFGEKVDSIKFDLSKNDFLDELMPFKNFDEWHELESEHRERLLSCGWLIYQYNTIHIETDLVIPACTEVIKYSSSFSSMSDLPIAMAEAITDEGYHTLLAVKTCEILKKYRNLQHVNPKDFRLVRITKMIISQLNDAWERRVAYIAISCCTENHISEYLDILDDKQQLQPLFAEAVSAHARDEWVHGSTFAILAKELWPNLNERGRNIFRYCVTTIANNFFRADTDAWFNIFDDLNESHFNKIRDSLIKSKTYVDEEVEFTNSNRGLKMLYRQLDWDWSKRDEYAEFKI